MPAFFCCFYDFLHRNFVFYGSTAPSKLLFAGKQDPNLHFCLMFRLSMHGNPDVITFTKLHWDSFRLYVLLL